MRSATLIAVVAALLLAVSPSSAQSPRPPRGEVAPRPPVSGVPRRPPVTGQVAPPTANFEENTCGNANSAPQIFSAELRAPNALLVDGSAPPNYDPRSGRITRNATEYVSSESMRFEIVTDNCTVVRSIRVGLRTLGTTSAGGYYFSAQPSVTPPSDRTRSGHNLWIFFPAIDDGTTDEVVITIGRLGGNGVATHSLRVVHVQGVHPISAPAAVSISRAEIWNRFTSAIHAKFGPANSYYLTNADGTQGRRLYDYDPSSFQLTMDERGIAFSFSFKADVNNWCDPTVRVHGRFRLVTDGGSVGFVWNEGDPQASLLWPVNSFSAGVCYAIEITPLVGQIKRFVQWLLVDDPTGGLQATLTDSITTSLSNVSASLFFSGAEHRDEEARILLTLPAPSIELRVPYDAFDTGRAGTLFEPSEPLVLLASGLGSSDYAAGGIQQATLSSAPNGIPLTGSVTGWPNPLTVSRAGALVYPARPVSNLLARTTNNRGTTTYAYRDGCGLSSGARTRLAQETAAVTTAGPRMIVFGVNDTAADAQRQRGYLTTGYTLRVFFMGGASACQSVNVPLRVR